MSELSGKTALITGSARGIGLAIAKSLAETGARIALHDLVHDEQAETACAEIKKAGAEDVRFFAADMREPEQISQLMQEVNKWGGTDILVNNAGIQKTAKLTDVDEELWNSILAVNLSSAFYTMKAALPLMEKRGYGRVINIASVNG